MYLQCFRRTNFVIGWWIEPRVLVSSPFSSCLFGELGKRGESCPGTRLVRGVGDGLGTGNLVDGISLCVLVTMFLVSCVLHISSQSCMVSSFLTLFIFWGLSSGPCIYMGCASSCMSPCWFPLAGWKMYGGNGGVNCGSRGEPLCDGVLLDGRQTG